MSTRVVQAGQEDETLAARVCIMGDPGVGKTRLAGTFPHPFFIDCENGAGSAVPDGPNRLVIPMGPTMVKDVTGALKSLNKQKPDAEGYITYRDMKIGTVIVDSADAIQQAAKVFSILKGRTKMERGDWGTLLEIMTPVLLEWQALPVNGIIIAHTKRRAGESKRPGELGFSVQGALKDQMPRWFSIIMHIMTGVDGKRYVVTQPMVHKNSRIQAKDRHNVLAGLVDRNSVVKLPGKDGYPNNAIANAICGTDETNVSH